MAVKQGARKRQRGEIETLPSGALRVRVYAGIAPVTHKRHYLVETVPAGPKADKQADKVRTRLLGEVDAGRQPRTAATVAQLMERYLDVLHVEETTRDRYEGELDRFRLGAGSLTRREDVVPALAGPGIEDYTREAAPPAAPGPPPPARRARGELTTRPDRAPCAHRSPTARTTSMRRPTAHGHR